MTETEAPPAVEVAQPVKERKTLTLSCKLTTEEWLEKSRTLANLLNERDDEESRQSLEKKAMKENLETLDDSIRLVRRIVSAAAEDREVEVEDRMDYETGNVVRYRTDTAQEIWRRKMTPDEQQIGMPGV